MRLLLIILLLAGTWAALISGQHQTFALMTVASIILLYLLPIFIRKHIGKVATYVHEVCHGMTSLLTGGKFERFLVGSQGGSCITSGGNRKFVTSAGYIGTVLFGAVCLAKSVQGSGTVAVIYLVAMFLSLSTLKAGDPYTATLGNLVAAAIGLSEIICPSSSAARFLLNFLGVILIWQGFEAIWGLYQASANKKSTGSDAEVMASMAGHSPAHWALVFGGIALVLLILICSAAIHLKGL